MKSRFPLFLSFFFIFFFSGCASVQKMPFGDEKNDTTSEDSIFLMSVNLKNSFHPSYQPRLHVVNLVKIDPSTNKEEAINIPVDNKAKYEETGSLEKGNTYLTRLALKPGTYQIQGLTSMATGFLIRGFFFTPIHQTLEAKEPGIFYLGRVSANVIERKGNEFKAGSSIPLIDQSTIGASGGTFDVSITDSLTEDEQKFTETFPILSGMTIKKAILRPFDREKAQKWWEAN